MAIAEIAPATQTPARPTVEKVPFFVARTWQGMTLSIWLRFLSQFGYRTSPSRWPVVLRFTMFGLCNSALAWGENIRYGRVIRDTQLKQPPLFVIGHWRTGTTWLHELLALDERFTYPSTYQCMAPHHFLSTQHIIPKLMPHMMPERRPMDNMAMGWERPQEDEFALCNLGAPSPYLRWAFSNEPCPFDHYLALRPLAEYDKKRWQKIFLRFLKHLTCGDDRRIVLKSPTHTARIAPLLEILPDAQFIHIVRDPYVVFSSTVRLWKQLWNRMGLQVPRYEGLEEYVFATFERMFEHYHRDITLLKEHQLCEVRYEDLREDLLGEMQRIYTHLDLGDFARVEPHLHKYMEQTKDYKTNVFEQSGELRAKIAERWADYFGRYGYEI